MGKNIDKISKKVEKKYGSTVFLKLCISNIHKLLVKKFIVSENEIIENFEEIIKEFEDYINGKTE